jgi:hypothetical protein
MQAQEIEPSQFHNVANAFVYAVVMGFLAIGLARNRKLRLAVLRAARMPACELPPVPLLSWSVSIFCRWACGRAADPNESEASQSEAGSAFFSTDLSIFAESKAVKSNAIVNAHLTSIDKDWLI